MPYSKMVPFDSGAACPMCGKPANGHGYGYDGEPPPPATLEEHGPFVEFFTHQGEDDCEASLQGRYIRDCWYCPHAFTDTTEPQCPSCGTRRATSRVVIHYSGGAPRGMEPSIRRALERAYNTETRNGEEHLKVQVRVREEGVFVRSAYLARGIGVKSDDRDHVVKVLKEAGLSLVTE